MMENEEKRERKCAFSVHLAGQTLSSEDSSGYPPWMGLQTQSPNRRSDLGEPYFLCEALARGDGKQATVSQADRKPCSQSATDMKTSL